MPFLDVKRRRAALIAGLVLFGLTIGWRVGHSDNPPKPTNPAQPAPSAIQASPSSTTGTPPTPATPSQPVTSAAWADYLSRFVKPEGRVVDTGAGGMSHSEAQGTAMLLAERHDEHELFDKLWVWTKTNLGVRKDGLLAWGWHPDGKEHVTDKNDASDGDLYVAWALAEAAARWNVPAYREAAATIGRAILAKLIRDTALGPVMLPGVEGFTSDKGLVLNQSYDILPAFRALSAVVPSPTWQKLIDTHMALLQVTRFGRFSLPPDWLFVPKDWKPANKTPALAPWPDKPARFGYDAIRVPLYLAWNGSDGRDLWPFLAFWSFFDPLPFHPGWFDLGDDAVPMDPPPAGFLAVRKLAEQAAKPAGVPSPFTALQANEDYFSASLTLLSDQAWSDRQPH